MAHRAPGKPDFIVGDSLSDIFAEAGIHLGRSTPSPGRNLKVICPKCGGGRTKEPSLSIKVDDDGQGAAWQCHRGNCDGFRGNGRVESGQQDDAPRAERERKPIEPPKPAKAYSAAQQDNRGPVYGWAEKRGISRETVDWFGLFATTAYFPQHKAERMALAFPYRWKGEVVGHKYRDAEKNHAQDSGTLPTLFNIDSLEAPDVLIWVEGEPDVFACHEAGYRQIVSLRDGAPQELKDEDDPRRADDKRFAALTTHADALKPVKKIILACDNDGPGMNLREELARRLGKARCWIVAWPEGCKDAGDVLRLHGPEKLRACIEAAEPWPMKGMVRVDAARLLQHRERGRLVRGQVCGIKALDEVVKMPVEGGRLIVVTGPPNHGKSALMRDWLVRLAAKHKRHIILASPEDGSVEVIAEQMAQVFAGGPFWPGPTRHLSDEEIAAAGDFIARNFTFLSSDDPDDELTIDWVLERADIAISRAGASLLVLDPFNEFDHLRQKNETETEYVGRTLKRLKAWGRSRGVDIVIVVHPRSLQADPKTKKQQMPTGYEISGSANWNNKSDVGLTVWRPVGAVVTEVHVWKSRYDVWGKRGSHATLQFDVLCGRFRSAGFTLGDQPPSFNANAEEPNDVGD